jgi:hypothetical protein
MLETHNYIDNDLTILISIGLEETLLDIKGRVVHSTSVDKSKYNTGIQFIELDDSSKQLLKKFIKTFRSHRPLESS